jgi:hypothetical protein
MNLKVGLKHLLGVASLMAGMRVLAAPEVIKYNNTGDANGNYALSMIKLALDHVDNKYTLEQLPGEYTQTRLIEDVKTANLDIMWAATNKDLEDEIEPIRIPLYKGLLGHRLFIIRKGDQARFDKVKTLDDLRQIPIGQGASWADTKILEAGGLKVVKTLKYQGLFNMLDGGRFDGFPRGVFEPFGEVANHPNLNLTVEKKLMLVYKLPFYLFVNKERKKLAADLTLGLNRAIEDGSFNKVFLASPNVQEAIQNGDLKNRLIFRIDNPTLSKETPIDREELWVDPKDL